MNYTVPKVNIAKPRRFKDVFVNRIIIVPVMQQSMSSCILTKQAAHGPARIKTTPKARSKRRSTHLPNRTQYGSTLEQFWSEFTGRKPV